MMSSEPNIKSHYGVFLDNYNKGNVYLNNMTGSFFDQIRSDQDFIINNDNGILKDKLLQIKELNKQKDKSNYEKTIVAGNILASILSNIVHAPEPVKKSGIDIINAFLNVAKETEDQQLIDTGLKFLESIPG